MHELDEPATAPEQTENAHDEPRTTRPGAHGTRRARLPRLGGVREPRGCSRLGREAVAAVGLSSEQERSARLDVLAAVRTALDGDHEGFRTLLANADTEEALRAAVGFLVGLVATMPPGSRAHVLDELTRAAVHE